MDPREIEISAITLAQRYEHEIFLESELPQVRQNKEGFPFLKEYIGRRNELICDFSQFAVNHDATTGCKTRAADSRVNLKGKKARVAEVSWAIFRPTLCNDGNKKPINICRTTECFAFEHSRMQTLSQANARKICRANNLCNCEEKCILSRKFFFVWRG